jgi:BirA family biotin operon repressor/biotin-[acetyl-CoA-carboxylase] ligase
MLDNGYAEKGLTVVSTDDQYAGRGQKGNTWESESGKNLSFSFLVHPSFMAAASQFILSQAMALSVLRVLNRLVRSGEESFTVKWPNDIYHDNRKICGTLIECDLQGKSISNCIIGTGLNVNQHVFTSDAPNPVSLLQLYGKEFNREELLCQIINQFTDLYNQLENGEWDTIRTEYAQNLYRKEGYHPYADASGTFNARIAGIEESGHLLLQDRNDHIRRYEFKEVRYIPE